MILAVLITIIVAFFGVIGWWNQRQERVQAMATQATPPPPRPELVTAKIERYVCYTPCGVPIDFAFTLDTQGDPIILKFPGIAQPVHYSGKGTIEVPDSRDIGIVNITSPDPAKVARVKIEEVIQAQKVR